MRIYNYVLLFCLIHGFPFIVPLSTAAVTEETIRCQHSVW